jgi:RNA polymerase sigma factor (sigma-70 family)
MDESDEAVFAALCRGDTYAFDILYERYAGRLFGFIRKHVSTEAIAEEVLQEVFFSIARDQNPSVACFRAWLFQIARNLCFNHLRSEKREASALTNQDERPSGLQRQDAERVLQSQEALASLTRAVGTLPAELAKLYTLRTNGLSYEEIAVQLSIPLGTVKSRMHQLILVLRAEVLQ